MDRWRERERKREIPKDGFLFIPVLLTVDLVLLPCPVVAGGGVIRGKRVGGSALNIGGCSRKRVCAKPVLAGKRAEIVVIVVGTHTRANLG